MTSTNRTKLVFHVSTGTVSKLSALQTRPVQLPAGDYEIQLVHDSKLSGDEIILAHAGARAEREQMQCQVPSGVVADDVTRIVNMSYDEVLRCYERGCYLAAIAMCGRTIETLLAELYRRRLGTHPSDLPKNNRPGIDGTITALKRSGLRLPGHINDKVKTISNHRSMAIHGSVVIPTQDEARSTIYLLRDVLTLAATQPLFEVDASEAPEGSGSAA